LVQLSL